MGGVRREGLAPSDSQGRCSQRRNGCLLSCVDGCHRVDCVTQLTMWTGGDMTLSPWWSFVNKNDGIVQPTVAAGNKVIIWHPRAVECAKECQTDAVEWWGDVSDMLLMMV